ncbi:MAG TPA: hypothetical protein VEL03_15650 [Streptosporangiaceae bacterium]|nr:hypothetical protein [Streptosporangiaceae bacterium]
MIVAVILVLLALSLLFGGFQMGKKTDGSIRQLSCQPAQCHGTAT